MADKNNKVKYNLKNAHYALLTIGEDGTVSYGNPTAIPGSVSISLDANGEPENFYADGIAYYVINNNMGYEGDLELALIPESFRTEVLMEELDDRGRSIMSMIKNIEIDGKQVPFKASAAIPRIYRMKFQRDIYKDLKALEKSVGDNKEEQSNLDMFSLEMFENIAFVMAKHADPEIPNSPEEWLDGFNTFSIYQVLPQLIELWGLNVQTDVESKKNFVQQSVR